MKVWGVRCGVCLVFSPGVFSKKSTRVDEPAITRRGGRLQRGGRREEEDPDEGDFFSLDDASDVKQ